MKLLPDSAPGFVGDCATGDVEFPVAFERHPVDGDVYVIAGGTARLYRNRYVP
jgi:hypothetical protein